MKNTKSTSRVRACESRVHPVLLAFAFAAYANGCAVVSWNFSLRAAKKKY